MAERMTWDLHADHDLLTAMMQELHPTQEQLRGIMARMHGFGYTCTVKAITQHLQKLRRKEEKNGGGDGAAGPSTPKTSGGRKKSVASSVKKEPGSGTKRKPVAVMSDDEEDMKPSKKFKDEPVKKEDSGKDSNIAYAG
ncbi:hypothetical protein N657DRAFT_683291 [Parathielavia appendiculata]|uniref:Uncharacterized protein n=1 Tax=Parathielavia appendiculata TaxID=2587402 RepID=A0AAN6TV77_9PEZI|nr:hypothetical protein N657DRAFT_683291 [Parathielavia appendiculata]